MENCAEKNLQLAELISKTRTIGREIGKPQEVETDGENLTEIMSETIVLG